MSVLVDTSVWVSHFQRADQRLVALLMADNVVCHPWVVAEVACGTPPQRATTLALLRALRQAPVATPEEITTLVEQRGLHGRGCGLVDMGLLAACLLHGRLRLWTLDKRLHAIATEMHCAWQPATHA